MQTETGRILQQLSGIIETSYPWCHSQRSSSPPAELLATEQQLSLKHQGTKLQKPSLLEHSASGPVWQETITKHNVPFRWYTRLYKMMWMHLLHLYWNSTTGHRLWNPTTFTTSPIRYLWNKKYESHLCNNPTHQCSAVWQMWHFNHISEWLTEPEFFIFSAIPCHNKVQSSETTP